MEIKYSKEELAIKEQVKKFVKNDLMPNARKINDTGVLSDKLKKKFIDMGILKLIFPIKYGGVEGSFTGFILSLLELSHATLVPSWMLVENLMLSYPVLHFGSEFLKKTYLPDLISLKTIGALAFTESDTGSDPTQLRTIAKKIDGGWLINGSKRFITNSKICNHMILFARNEDAVTAFLVHSEDKGYRPGKREKFIHIKSFDNGDVSFENYLAQDDHVIGKVGEGFSILLQTEALSKIAFCAFYVGMAERALDLSIHYAKTRTHRDQSIGQKFQMIQVKLAEMAARLEGMKAYLMHTSSRVDQGEDIFLNSAALKILVSRDIKWITAAAMEIHGAYGLSQEYDISRLFQASISAQVIMGNIDIQRVILAKGILGKEHLL